MALIKFEKQQLLGKHAKNFAADKNEIRLPFQGIRYEKNGTAYVSNTHVLLRVKDVSPFSEPHTLHAITGAEIEGAYPSEQAMNDLMAWDPVNRFILDKAQIEEVTRYSKIAQMVEKELKPKVKIVNLTLCDQKVYLEVKDQGITLSVMIGTTEKHQAETWALNADYLYNAMNLFKSAKSGCLVIKLKNNCSPILLSDEENQIDILILPIRTH